MTSARRLGRSGISLPLVIFLMAMLALAVTVGFARVSDERRIVGDQRAQLEAFTIAQSGLERYFAEQNENPGPLDSVAYTLGSGTAYVHAFEIRAPSPSEDGIYLIRSRGVSTSAFRYDERTPPAQRIVAQYASWRQVDVDIDAAWTALSGLRSQGNNGSINGNDDPACSPAASPVYGVGVPFSLSSWPHQYPEGFSPAPYPLGLNLTGSPPRSVLTLGADPIAAAGPVHINWEAIRYGNALAGTVDWPPPSGFGDWPTIFHVGDLSLSQTGRGLLIVTGDLDLMTGFQWDGLILVGRRALVTGTPIVRGAIISGLDTKLVGAPHYHSTFYESNSGDNGSDAINLRYSSCNIAAALQRHAHLVPISNAWTDSWPE